MIPPVLKTLAANRDFFIPYALFLLFGGALLLFLQQGDDLIFFSDLRTYWGDRFFVFWTKLGEEPAYFLAAFLFLFVRFRWSLLVALTGLLVSLFSFGLKSFFGRPRPRAFYEAQDVSITDILNLVDGMTIDDLYSSATNSFPSGHTMSGFALYGLLALLLSKRFYLPFWLFVVALLVGISRVYLVQHFFEDIYVGSLVGVLIALGLYWGSERIAYHPQRWYDRKIPYRGRRPPSTLPGDRTTADVEQRRT